MKSDVAIIGGGMIGLATAFELAERGVTVDLLENRSTFGAGATAAAIGGLTPQSETYCRGPLRYVATWSTSMYPDFLARISERGGSHVNFLKTGQLQVALDDDEMARITRDLVPIWTTEGFETIVLDHDQTLEHEPTLSPSLVGSVLLPVETAVDPPEVAASLLAALRTYTNVRLVNDANVAGVRTTGGHPEVAFVDGQTRGYATIVVAAGLATRDLIPEIARGIYPMRGQGVEFRTSHSGYPLHHHVYTANGGPRRSAYMVPRADGRVAAGVTYEPNVDSEIPDDATIDSIVDGLIELCPAVSTWEQIRAWSGVRPASVDGIPYIGIVSPGVVVGAGHQGLGITLAPVTGYLVAEVLTKGADGLGDRERRALEICNPTRVLNLA